MTNYHATLGHYQPTITNVAASVQKRITRLLLGLGNWLADRQTRSILSSLDRETLEDIGVPYEDRSPESGELNRYPDVIRPERLG